ncbi:hypothetical protein AAKU55_003293 [Oxalobacteraceae bacterium GrIS 1.11]
MHKIPALLCLFVSLLTGCNAQATKDTFIMSQKNTAHVGEQGEIFAKRYPEQLHVNRQPAGLDFYQLRWTTSAPGSLTIEHGKNSFNVENALSFTGTQDLTYPEEGMSELSVRAGVTATDLISHDEARKKMHAILQNILQAGWTRFIDRGDPRLSGKDMLEFILTTSSASSLDPKYNPTLEEWMSIHSMTIWTFYANHVYLEVSFMREHTLTDPTKPGAYIVNFNLKSEAEHFRAYVGSHNRKKWKELLPAELLKLPPMRAEAEAAMRLRGIKIDETYQDPPVPDFVKK